MHASDGAKTPPIIYHNLFQIRITVSSQFQNYNFEIPDDKLSYFHSLSTKMRFSLTPTLAMAMAVSSVGAVGSLRRMQSGNFPESFSLPDGFRPEGSVAGTGNEIFISCTSGLQVGSIWKGDIRTGEGSVLIPPTGDATRGISLDKWGRLWVCWTSGARVYDSETGLFLKEYIFTFTEETDLSVGVINDVIVAGTKVIFTDSGATIPNGRGDVGIPRLFVVEIASNGAMPDEFSEIRPTTTDVELDSAWPTLNGIETVPADTSKVVACHTNLGLLVNIDLTTGEASVVDVGVPNEEKPFSTCDGLVRRGNALYVVRNRDSAVSEVKLNPDGTAGTVETVYDVAAMVEDPNLDTPTTGALYGDYLHMPDSRFRLNCNEVDCNTAPFSVHFIKLN